jgi:oligosaccharide repeat unit polymerase
MAGTCASKKQYALLIFLCLVGLYELPLPILLSFPTAIGDDGIWTSIRAAMSLPEFNQDNTYRHQTILLLWAVSLFIGYRLKYQNKSNEIIQQPEYVGTSAAITFLSVVFIIGLICAVGGAGKLRLADYANDFYSSNAASGGVVTLLGYGQMLLICATIAITAIINQLPKGKRLFTMVICLILLSPLLREIFLAGRRQYFAPSMLFLVLYLLHNHELKGRKYILFFTTVSAIIVGTIQFTLRQITQGGGEVSLSEIANSDISILYIFEEFIGVGAVSFNTVNSIPHELTIFFENYFVGALKGIPFLHLDLIIPEATGWKPWNNYAVLSPFGAFSMLADAWLAAGYFGIILSGILAGYILRKTDDALAKCISSQGSQFTLYQIFSIGLFISLLSLYRKGIGDAFALTGGYIFVSLFFFWMPVKLALTKIKDHQTIH